MKKIFISIAACLLIVSCGGTKSSSSVESEDSTMVADETPDTEDEPEPIGRSAWELGEFVDDYGDKTGEKYVYTIASGDFSNSATTNSNLTVQVVVKKNTVNMYFYEYDSSLAKDDERMDLKIKDEKGDEYKFNFYVGSNGCGYIRQGNNNDAKLIELLNTNSSLKCSSRMGDYVISTYRFTIDCEGFQKMYKETFE